MGEVEDTAAYVEDRLGSAPPLTEEDYACIPSWADELPVSWLANPYKYLEDDLSPRYGEAVESTLAAYEDQCILDMGCGDTTGVAAIAGDQNTVVQADINPAYVQTLQQFKDTYQEQTAEQIRSEPVIGNVHELPFDDDSFDVVFAGTLYSTYHPENDVFRVLNTGGHMLLASRRISEDQNVEEVLEAYGIKEHTFADASVEDHLLALTGYRG